MNPPERNITQAMQLFQQADLDHNGTISKEEFFKLLAWQGIIKNQTQLDALFANADKNGDGQIDIYEFIKLVDALC